MSWYRVARGTHILNCLKDVNPTWLGSRNISNILGRSSYEIVGANGGSGRGLYHAGFSTRSAFSRSHPFSSSSPEQIWRSSLHIIHRSYSYRSSVEQKSRKMLLYLWALVFAMVGASYAAVPLYRRFCQATGYGGTIQRRESVEEKIARHSRDGTLTSREIVVQFNADVSDGMPWKFIPTQREVRVKPGESALAFYTAENRSSTPITGVSTYNVTPMKAAVYFNKIQCFCFEEQRLLPGEQIDMPVFFYIDPEFETDPRMDGINNITIFKYDFEHDQWVGIEKLPPIVQCCHQLEKLYSLF